MLLNLACLKAGRCHAVKMILPDPSGPGSRDFMPLRIYCGLVDLLAVLDFDDNRGLDRVAVRIKGYSA